MKITQNTLFYGDNLKILREYIDDNSIDLVYLDPPFNSKATYNVLFKELTGEPSEAQITAFEDTWHWTEETQRTFEEIVETAPPNVVEMIKAFKDFIGCNDMMAYLTNICIRLLELKRVLKNIGSIYLHCDPTASHYLKLVMDAVFGPKMFRNEIVWRRSQTRSSISKIYRRAHDVVLFYAKSNNYLYNIQYRELSEASKKLYTKRDECGFYRTVPLLVSGCRKGTTGKPWRGIDPNTRGKDGMHWLTTPDKLEEYEKKGLIVWPSKPSGAPNLKYYLEGLQESPLTIFGMIFQ